MLLVVRPMLGRIMQSGNLDITDDTLALAGAGGDLNAAIAAAGRNGGAPLSLPGPDGKPISVAGGGGSEDLPSVPVPAVRARQSIDFSNVEGNVKDSSLKKIAEIVDRHPDEAVAILRNWLYQDR